MARRSLTRRLVLGGVAAAALVAGAWLVVGHLDRARLERPIPSSALPAVVVIEPGSSLTAIANDLAGAGLLEHPGSWVRQARREGVAARVHAGEYVVPAGATPRAVLDLLVAGQVRLHSVTLVEGWTYRQALAALQAHPAVVATLTKVTDESVREAVGLGQLHPEGQFFPDTYLFARGTREVDLLRQAHERLSRELALAWDQRRTDLPLASPYEALILASIVEKETGVAGERPLIAGVFANRLRRGMRLQTDPTVIYGLGESFDGNLRKADLQRDTPYNTYTRAGLPPTPIALVGREALEAAVQPADTEALYFVATGRGDGRHYFSRTLAEHNDNVARYLATLRGATEEGPP